MKIAVVSSLTPAGAIAKGLFVFAAIWALPGCRPSGSVGPSNIAKSPGTSVAQSSAGANATRAAGDGISIIYHSHNKGTGADDSFVVARRGSDSRFAGPGFAVMINGQQRTTCQAGVCKKDAAPAQAADGPDVFTDQWLDPWGPNAVFGAVVTGRRSIPNRTVAGVISECQVGTYIGATSTSCRALKGGFLTFHEDSSMREELQAVRPANDSDFSRP